MRLRALLLALMALSAASPGRAAPVAAADVEKKLAAIDAKLEACTAKDSSDAGMKACTGDAYAAADRVLTFVYKSIVVELKTSKDDGDEGVEKLKRLVAAERAWIAFRDADCILQGVEMLGGSGESLAIGTCNVEQTKARATRLAELFAAK